MAQREQINPNDHFEGRVQRAQRRRVDQPVHTAADEKTDVIGDEDVIESVGLDRFDEPGALVMGCTQDFRRRQRSDAQRYRGQDLRRLRAMRNADSCPL